MYSEKPKIVVAGDATIDWYFWKRSSGPHNGNINWNKFDGINVEPKHGGSLLLSQMLHNILGTDNSHIIDQKSPRESDDRQEQESGNSNKLLYKSCNQILHTNIELGLYPKEPDSKDSIYRVKRSLGFTTPAKCESGYPEPLNITNDDNGENNFVIIHDSGNGFRFKKEKWPKSLEKDRKPYIVYLMFPPLFKGDLWNHVLKYHKNRLILIINAEDLRKHDINTDKSTNINISRSLSWEKTALEFLWEMKHSKKLAQIKDLPNLIVRFKVEGAIHYNGQDRNINPKLYFDPFSLEDGFWDSKKYGMMSGISIVFVSSLASKLINSDIKEGQIAKTAIREGIKFGMLKSRKFLKIGHGLKKVNLQEKQNPNKNYINEIYKPEFFDGICEKLFSNNENDTKSEDDRIECVELPFVEEEPDLSFWSILGEKTKEDETRENKDPETIAEDVVKNGWSALKGIPVGRFGKLITVDRKEIESFRSIMNIMKEYLASNKTSRPLSIAVFGYPGSGKSFGITEVAKSIDPDNLYKIDFNVSQFTSIKDLTNAFHRIRDISLRGKVPLVFFDEFDCTFETKPLGWLKYFLVPMQDGEFMDSGNVHPIGKSIFVFAGGIYKNFREFCKSNGISCGSQKDSTEQTSSESCQPAIEKCPDFVSRLRGYVNILGPNVTDEDKDSKAYIIRRAIILRSLIEDKIPNIIENESNKEGTAHIDSSLLKALLKVPKYIHGTRSMEAIIDMSILAERKCWEKASLPPKDQLEFHIDSVEFSRLLAKN
jgi:hypothetical protein